MVIGIFCAFIPIFLVFLSSSSNRDAVGKNVLTLLPDDKGDKEVLPPTSPVLLRINIHDTIGRDMMTATSVESQLIESRKGILKGDRVKGILLHINSPGGGVSDSDNIYRQLMEYKQRFKVPVYAYVDGLCASGGMYIASASDKILTSPTSIIGSVGVFFGPFFNVMKMLDIIGVQTKTLLQGKDKTELSPFKKWDDDEGKAIEPIVSYIYDRFLTIVSTARPKLTVDKLKNEYGAHIFDAQKACEIGYTDAWDIGYNEALKELAKASNINEEEKYQLVELKPRKLWLNELLQGTSNLLQGKIKHEISLTPEEKEPFSLLYPINSLSQ